MRPKFKYSDLKNLSITEKDSREWEKDNNLEKDWVTPEMIPVKSVYTKEDLEGMEHLELCCRITSIFAWTIFRHVCNDAMDHQTICRIFDC